MSSVLPSPSLQLARSLHAVQLDALTAMTPFDLFKSQLESGSTEACVDAMKRLGVVSAAMGESETATQLLPYLTQTVLQQPPPMDEILLIMGQQLVQVMDVLGDAKYAKDFLPMLERLAAIEETVVREQAVTVLNVLSGKCSPKHDAAPWTAMAKRLASADWFTAKVSACGIIAGILALLPDNKASGQQELLQVYKELSHDETPMVRRAAAKHIGHVLCQATAAHKEFGAAHLPVLCRDEQDSVRLLAVAALAHAGPSFGKQPAWTVQHWLPLVKDGSTDSSWRVRNNLGKHFSDVANTLGINGDRKYQAEQSLVMACFVALLTDAEAEVRAAAVGHLARMVAWGGPQLFAAHLQPLLPALADDVVMEVRSKCALALMDAAHGGTLDDAIILQAFGPLLESFLQDEFQEVQLQVLTNLHKIAHLLPGLSGVVTSLLQMSKASNWRVRQSVAQLLPHLAEARGLDFFTTVLLEPAWLTLLLDPVATVRKAIVSGMNLLTKVAGEEWILSTLLPQHIRIYNQNANLYLVRLTILRAHVETALAAQAGGPLWQDLVLQILRALVDKVPNVRMHAAMGLQQIIVAADDHGVVQAQIKPALEKRLEDADLDCRQTCRAALDVIP